MPTRRAGEGSKERNRWMLLAHAASRSSRCPVVPFASINLASQLFRSLPINRPRRITALPFAAGGARRGIEPSEPAADNREPLSGGDA